MRLDCLFFVVFAVLVFAETAVLQSMLSFTWMNVVLAGSVQAHCLSFDYFGVSRWFCEFDITTVLLFMSQVCFVWDTCSKARLMSRNTPTNSTCLNLLRDRSAMRFGQEVMSLIKFLIEFSFERVWTIGCCIQPIVHKWSRDERCDNSCVFNLCTTRRAYLWVLSAWLL